MNEGSGWLLPAYERMARSWPFFDDLLAKVEMVCGKTDIEVARAYVTHLGGDQELLASLVSEYERAVRALLRIRDHTRLLDDSPVLQASIALRNLYVDPLSLLQISLLRRKRRADPGDEGRVEEIDNALATTLSGIAQGLRKAG